MARGRVLLSLAVAIEVSAVGSAAAHSRAPEVTQITVHEGKEALVATTRGLLFGDPRAGRWSLLCGEAFGVATGASYRMAQLASGRLFVSNARGMRVSDDQGCSWRPHPSLGELDVTSLFQEAARPERLYVTVFGAEQGGIHVSEDGGDTFRALYRADLSEFVNSVEVAKNKPAQLYATLSTTEEIPRMFVLRSSDAGATWSRAELSGAEELIDVSVLAVNPADANELLLRVRYIDSRKGDGLLQSRDGAQSFTLLPQLGRIADATFTEDGTTSFVIASGKVLRASTPDRRYAPIDAIDGMTYGALVDQQLLLSGYRVVDNQLNVSVWSSDVESTSTLQRWMSFDEVTSVKACPAPSPVSELCARDWVDWTTEFLTSATAAMP